MLKRYEIKRRSKLLAVLNFILASFIVYTINSVVSYYMEREIKPDTLPQPAVRVIANSNSLEDQAEKQQIAQIVHNFLQQQLESPNDELKATTYSSYPQPAQLAQQLHEQLRNNYPQNEWQIFVGPQLIPPKIVGNRLYPQAKTEAIVVKLGNGRGDNWFCALFPNSCEPSIDEKQDEEEHDEPRESLLQNLWQWITNI